MASKRVISIMTEEVHRAASRRTTPQIASTGLQRCISVVVEEHGISGVLPVRFERTALIFPTSLIKSPSLPMSPFHPLASFLLDAAGIQHLIRRTWKPHSNAIIAETSVNSRCSDDNWIRWLSPSSFLSLVQRTNASSRTSHALRIINPTMLSSLTLYPRVHRANRIGDALFSFHQCCPFFPSLQRTAVLYVRVPIRRIPR